MPSLPLPRSALRGLLRRLRLPAWLLVLVLVLVPPLSLAVAQQPTSPPTAAMPAVAEDTRTATIVLNHRPIVTFRATLLGRSPAERASQGQAALQAAVARGGAGQVTVWLDGELAGLRVDEGIVFYLVPGDLEGGPAVRLSDEAEAARQRLQAAVLEAREAGNLHRIAVGLGVSAAATLIAFLLVRGLYALRRRSLRRLESMLADWQGRHPGTSPVKTYAQYAASTAHGLATLLTWLLVFLVVDLWITFVMRQFAYTRPWAERSTQWLLDVLSQFALAIAHAVPGLLTAGFIFFLARLVSRALSAFLLRIERGDLVVGWLDADIAGPTRRVGSFIVWLFALAMAYPFLPGASSEAFKGVTVLAGLMLSLGASGVVGQVVSGLSVMYSRTLRPGEYVRIGDTEGTVTEVGMFATKVHTGLGEEVSLPNAVVFSQSVRNFSRLVQDGQFVLHTEVTIGYATPWRQVHAMLLEAARRTPGVAQDPAPYVMQTALSDFYVEYRLCAQATRGAPRRRAEVINQMHGNIQDVFNENGVQIMSPHYLADPAEPQVVPPESWQVPLRAAPPPAPRTAP